MYSAEIAEKVCVLREKRRRLLLELAIQPNPRTQNALDSVKNQLFRYTQNPIYK